ncbi:hypothetical protein KSP40_PGU002925 [Platanthera guangdongensis]|uniref:Uncharacterized protein n=1 Tax=Platanthera guangdongensis TaxID=2320717 RepID=A0ABR2LLC4_9ASPA
MEAQPVVGQHEKVGGIWAHHFLESTERCIPAIEKRPREPGGKIEVTFYKLDEGAPNEFAGTFYQTMMDMARMDEEMGHQMCAYVLSAINVWFPMSNTIENFMRGINWQIQILYYPSQQPKNMSMSIPVTWREILVTFAQVLLIFFKNIFDVNYTKYMLKRVQAVRSLVSCPDAHDNVLALPLERAKVIRHVLGGAFTLRKELLEYILTAKNETSVLGRMCTYLSEILSWTDMTHILFMFEELVLTSSPVLRSSEVAVEARNLDMALVSIRMISHPQYYKILAPVSDHILVDRNKFPILTEVARRLKEGKSLSAQNFRGSANVNPDTVNRLLALHRGQHKPMSKVYEKTFEFLAGRLSTSDGHWGLMNNYMDEV